LWGWQARAERGGATKGSDENREEWDVEVLEHMAAGVAGEGAHDEAQYARARSSSKLSSNSVVRYPLGGFRFRFSEGVSGMVRTSAYPYIPTPVPPQA
jgi:hypothetical protein